MDSNHLGVGIILVSVMMTLSLPFYPDQYQDKVVNIARDVLVIGATMINPSTRRRSDFERPKDEGGNNNGREKT